MRFYFEGNYRFFSDDFFNSIDENSIIMGKEPYNEVFMSNTKDNLDVYKCIFKANEISNVVYFSNLLDGTKEYGDEEEKIRILLNMCSEFCVKNFIYVTSNESIKSKFLKNHNNDIEVSKYNVTKENQEKKQVKVNDSVGKKINSYNDILRNSCEMMCKFASTDKGINVVCLMLPYIATNGEKKCRLDRWISDAYNGHVEFDGRCNDRIDFIYESELARLIKKIGAKKDKGYKCLYVDGRNVMTYEELMKYITDNFINYSDIKTTYKEENEGLYAAKTVFSKSQRLAINQFYGWYPKGNIIDYIEKKANIIYKNEKIHANNKKSISRENRKIRKRGKKRNKKNVLDRIKRVIGVLVICAIFELLGYIMREYVGVKDVDYRIFYVIVIAVKYGSGLGCLGAIMAMISYVYQKKLYMNLNILIYNVSSWCNLFLYFIAAILPGYFTSEKEDKIESLNHELKSLTNQNVFLNEVYTDAVVSKDKMAKQIIGFNDSYGKIYDIVKKLNRSSPDNVMYEALISMEQMLGSMSVAFYIFDENKKYARLAIASKSLNEKLDCSIKLDDYKEAIHDIKNDGVYINRQCDTNMPCLLGAITHKDILFGMILIEDVKYEDMNSEYVNKFRILNGLINDSLYRAIKMYNDVLKNDCINGTRILKWERFKKILKIKDKIKNEGLSKYYLGKIERSDKDYATKIKNIQSRIRNDDIIGQGIDGNIYIIFNQADKSNFDKIRKRIMSKI